MREDANLGRWPLDLANALSLRSVTRQSAVRLGPEAPLQASPVTIQSAVRLGPEASESHPYAGAIQRVLALEGLDVLSWRNHMGSRAVL